MKEQDVKVGASYIWRENLVKVLSLHSEQAYVQLLGTVIYKYVPYGELAKIKQDAQSCSSTN